MKKPGILIFILLMIITGCKKTSTTTDEELLDTTQHDNCLNIWPEQFSPSMSYSYSGDHSITSGQPWSGVSSSGYHGGLQILVKAGRKGSYDVANWFNSNAPNAACTISSLSLQPYELNFAFTGTITINGNTYAVTIGQGHSGASNNWWIGGPGWVFQKKSNPGKICTPDRKYTISEDDTAADIFWVTQN